MLNTPITDILVDENGKVTGVKAVNNETKEEIEVECEAVIIASGGIMEDREMMKKYTGFTFTDYNCSGDGNVLFNCYPNSDQTGDGQKLAWKLGGCPECHRSIWSQSGSGTGNRGKFSVDCIQRDTYHSGAAISVGKQKW